MTSLLARMVPRLLLRARAGGSPGEFSSAHWQTDGTFVFADISGFTKLSEQLAELGRAGAEELTVMLNATFESLLRVAAAEGGDLVKFGGDALLLFFDGDAHAQRACRAAHGMRATLKARGPILTNRGRVVLRISMGVHSGPFQFVATSRAQRELFVLGEHATTVTAMESAADAGEILISAATAAALPTTWLGARKGPGVLLRRVGDAIARPLPTEELAAVDDEALAPFIPKAVRNRLLDDEHGAEHRRATIAFVHVGGIDATLREAGAEVVSGLLDRVAEVAIEAAERHEVALLASDVAGGGIKLILTAGVPDAVEDGEGRMLAVARSLVDAELGLPVRVGVHTGYVFAGEVGASWRRVYTVMGDTVNLAARLMAKAEPGEVVASRLTLEHSSTPFVASALEPFMVKGKRHPQNAAVVGRRKEGRGRDLGAVPFVGRSGELGALLDAMRSATGDAGACVEIVGEPGIGKSRLVRELLAATGNTRVVRITCEPFAVDRPYFMARVVLRTALKISLDATPRQAGTTLIEWLETRAPEWLPFAPLLAVAIDADVPSTTAVDDLGNEHRAGKLREAAAAVLLRAFADPLVLVVEDAMWMDEASSLLLATALQGVSGSRWFGCFTTRDRSLGLSARLGFDASVIELTPLDTVLAENLVAQLTDDGHVPHSELLELCARAKGNPLFLLELARARLELGSLDAIPGTLEDLIAARIDRLSPADRNLLRHAAVLGDRFEPALFDRALGDAFPKPTPWHRVGDLLVLDQGELRFSHDLIRRVAYAGLPFRARRELHLRIAEALLSLGEPDDSRLGLLALHFDGSGDHARAWTYNRLAGERAAQNYATLEATAFFERAVGNVRDGHSVDRLDLAETYESMADVALRAGRFDVAREGLRWARKLRHDDRRGIARLCRKEGKLRERRGQYATAERWFRRGLRMLESTEDIDAIELATDRAQLEVEWASFCIMRQKYRPGVRWCRRALPDALAAADRATEAHVYYLLEWALGELGDDEARRYRDLAQPIYEDLGDYVGLGAVLINRGVDALADGRWSEASAHFEDARVAYQRGGDVVAVAHAAHNLAEVFIEQGRHAEAELCLRESRRIWRASGFAMGLAAVTSALGRTMARSGRTEDGVALLRDALQRFEALEHAPFIAEAQARLAEAFVFGGRWQEAVDVVVELGDKAADGGPAIAALARRMHGIAVVALGDVDAGRALLEDACQLADKAGIAWESALAAIELAQLPDTTPEEGELLVGNATVVLRDMGVVLDAVLPPSSHGAGLTARR